MIYEIVEENSIKDKLQVLKRLKDLASISESNPSHIITNTFKFKGVFVGDFETFVANDYNRLTEEPFENIRVALESWEKSIQKKLLLQKQ